MLIRRGAVLPAVYSITRGENGVIGISSTSLACDKGWPLFTSIAGKSAIDYPYMVAFSRADFLPHNNCLKLKKTNKINRQTILKIA